MSGAATAGPQAPLVVFDGVCNLCAASVRFVLAWERADTLRFAAVQSAAGAAALRLAGLDPADPASFLFVEDGVVHQRSAAALRLARHLRQPWPALAALARLVPAGARDAVYDWVARNRFGWFGRRDVCLVPTPALRDRFLD